MCLFHRMLPVTSLWPPQSSFHSIFVSTDTCNNITDSAQSSTKYCNSEALEMSTRLNSPWEASGHKVRMSLSLICMQSVSAFASLYFSLANIWDASMCFFRVCVRACVCLPGSVTSCRSAAAVRLQSCPRPSSQPLFRLSAIDLLAALPPCLGWNISPVTDCEGGLVH